MHIVLECVSPRAPYLLENRSDQGLRYRQVGISDLPYVPLPPYSAAGFSWQKDPSSGGKPSVRRLHSATVRPSLSMPGQVLGKHIFA